MAVDRDEVWLSAVSEAPAGKRPSPVSETRLRHWSSEDLVTISFGWSLCGGLSGLLSIQSLSPLELDVSGLGDGMSASGAQASLRNPQEVVSELPCPVSFRDGRQHNSTDKGSPTRAQHLEL